MNYYSAKEALNSGMLDIHHPITGQILYALNPFILNEHQAWDNLEYIKDMHTLKQVIFLDMKQETNPKRLKQLALDVQEVEFQLQELWGFPKDARYHKFWQRPKCTCPKIDNEDHYATGYCVVNSDCPLHGREPSYISTGFDSISGSGKAP